MDSLKPITLLAPTQSQATEAMKKQLPPFQFYNQVRFEKEPAAWMHYDEEIRSFRGWCERDGMVEEGEAFIASFMESEEGKAYKAQKIEVARAELWGYVSAAGVSDRYRDKVLKTYKTDLAGQRKAKDAVEAIAGNNNSAAMLVLYGPPGTGKTHLGAAAIYERYMKNGCREFSKGAKLARIGTQAGIARRVRNTYGEGASETEREVMRELTGCGLLVVDEIGAGSGTDHEKQVLCDILCERYNGKKATIMISNLTIDGLKSALGDRVMDRINEDPGSGFLLMNWPSQRAAQKAGTA